MTRDRLVMMTAFATLIGMAMLTGCGRKAAPNPPKAAGEGPASNHAAKKVDENSEEEAGIAATLVKLSPEDAALAKQQRFCAVESENRLGGMGPPVKVTINGQAVFLCCKGCQKRALVDSEKTLAAWKTLMQPASAKEPVR